MKAPSFSLKDQDGKTVSLSDFKGKKLLLYFYPKADTPGCTTQACGLRDSISLFRKRGVAVVGVSPDEVDDLMDFSHKYALPFTLLADPETKTIKEYGVWGQKSFMGRSYMGVFRTSFLIDEKGDIVKRYDNVKPDAHADMILTDLMMFDNESSEGKTQAVVSKKKVAKKKAPAKKKALSKKSPKSVARTKKL